MRPVQHRAPHFPVPCREESKERRNARWHTTLLAKSSVLHLGYTLVPADAEKGLREAPASTCSVAEGCADGRGS